MESTHNRKTIDEIDEARHKEDFKKIEAIFFVSGRFLTIQELISFSDLNPIIIRELIEKLEEKYDKEDSAIEIVKHNNSWKMDVKMEYSNIVSRLATGSSEFSKAEKETLAIIAYKQPIKQSVLVKIRSNKAYEHIKKFLDLGLIKKKRNGHTYDVSLSDNFYDYFNVENSEEGIFDRARDSKKNDESQHTEEDKNNPLKNINGEMKNG
ncbi:MAG: SMC-Scp complex subunit ScpB [Nanoarchaeota archaeon]|nr:SMC-Scp complex subunit ScpB [Nanoarchaeota archaeon]